MSILLSREILSAVENELRNASTSVQIISAYCKLATFERLAKNVSDSALEKRAMFRFRLDDVLAGSTDFDILDYCLNNGWKVWIRFDLHAKTYIVDNKRGIIGSANATSNGLGLSAHPNSEIATLVDVSGSDIKKIDDLYKYAIPVDGDLVTALRSEMLHAVDSRSGLSFPRWSDKIEGMFSPVVTTLFSYELPDRDSFSPGEYAVFLDDVYYGNDEQIAEKFRWSNAYLWLRGALYENEGELYFGALASLLHDALVEDPKPYRRDVKEMLSNLLCLVAKWGSDDIVIDCPHYSQRVRLIGC